MKKAELKEQILDLKFERDLLKIRLDEEVKKNLKREKIEERISNSKSENDSPSKDNYLSALSQENKDIRFDLRVSMSNLFSINQILNKDFVPEEIDFEFQRFLYSKKSFQDYFNLNKSDINGNSFVKHGNSFEENEKEEKIMNLNFENSVLIQKYNSVMEKIEDNIEKINNKI